VAVDVLTGGTATGSGTFTLVECEDGRYNWSVYSFSYDK